MMKISSATVGQNDECLREVALINSAAIHRSIVHGIKIIGYFSAHSVTKRRSSMSILKILLPSI